MKNYLAPIILSISLVLFSCEKSKISPKDKNRYSKAENSLSVDSLKIVDTIQINNKLSVKYETTLLVFPNLKNKTLLDSIYLDKKGLTEYSTDALKKIAEEEKKMYFNIFKDKAQSLPKEIKTPRTLEKGYFMKMMSQSNDFLQLEYLYTSDEGGAHGNYSFKNRVFDLKNNKKLELNEITSLPKSKIEKLLLKNINKISRGAKDSNGSVNNSDMLLVEVIPSNENFYFDEKNLYFHYSPYEIAAYAAGDIIIPISWKDLEGSINPDFKNRLKIN